MSPELRLALGEITDEEYFADLDRELDGWSRLPIARPGWSNRWVGVVRMALYVLAMVAFALLVIFTFALGPVQP